MAQKVVSHWLLWLDFLPNHAYQNVVMYVADKIPIPHPINKKCRLWWKLGASTYQNLYILKGEKLDKNIPMLVPTLNNFLVKIKIIPHLQQQHNHEDKFEQ